MIINYFAFRPGAGEFFFPTPQVNIFYLDPPNKGGGVSDSVPSPKRHTYFNVKPNTGNGREPSPPATY